MTTWTGERLRLASLEITQRCNNTCPYCDQPKSAQDMPFGLYVELVDQLAREGFDAIALGGGEPTLHPTLPALLKAARERGLRTGLTTNSRDPRLVRELAGDRLLDSFGVSAAKGDWLDLAGHPRAVVNLLLLREGLPGLLGWAGLALRHSAQTLLLLGYKGGRQDLTPGDRELSAAFALLSALGRAAGATVAADDYTRRRLGLTDTCGEGFTRITIDGTRDRCCFPACKFRPT